MSKTKKSRTIRLSADFDTSTEEVFEMLTKSRKHSEFTGAKASASDKQNGKFTAYDGYIQGVNLEVKKNKKLVQSWKTTDWEPGVYSQLTWLFDSRKKKCRVTLIQTGVPAFDHDAISQGWKDFYFIPLREYIKKSKLKPELE